MRSLRSRSHASRRHAPTHRPTDLHNTIARDMAKFSELAIPRKGIATAYLSQASASLTPPDAPKLSTHGSAPTAAWTNFRLRSAATDLHTTRALGKNGVAQPEDGADIVIDLNIDVTACACAPEFTRILNG